MAGTLNKNQHRAIQEIVNAARSEDLGEEITSLFRAIMFLKKETERIDKILQSTPRKVVSS